MYITSKRNAIANNKLMNNNLIFAKKAISYNEVTHCKAIYPLKDREIIIPAIIYRENIYIWIDSYRKEEKYKAFHRSWALTSNNLKNIVVQQKDLDKQDVYTIWRSNNNLKIDNNPNSQINFAYSINIKRLVSKMRQDSRLVKNRRYRFKLYPKCLIGKKAVIWLKSYFNISSEIAIEVGQRLIDDNLLHHVCDEHDFKDDYLFYRFYADE